MLGLFSIWFLVAYPIVLMQVIRTLRFKEGFVNHMTGTAITNSVPSGGALALPLNYGIYMSWGFTPGSVSAGLLGAGVWDWLARLSLPVLAVIGIAAIGQATGWMWVVSLVGIAIVATMTVTLVKVLRSESGAESMARFADSLGSKVLGLAKRDNPGHPHDGAAISRGPQRNHRPQDSQTVAGNGWKPPCHGDLVHSFGLRGWCVFRPDRGSLGRPSVHARTVPRHDSGEPRRTGAR